MVTAVAVAVVLVLAGDGKGRLGSCVKYRRCEWEGRQGCDGLWEVNGLHAVVGSTFKVR